MTDLAKMLGDPEKVHFVKLTEGSVKLVHAVEPDIAPLVDSRVEQLESGTADIIYLSAYRALNKKLREDGSHGTFYAEDQHAHVLDFPGVLAPEPVVINGVPQAGTVDGVIIRVGGVRDEIPVTVQTSDQRQQKCIATKPLAKQLAQHLFEGELRLYGSGKWSRNEDGIWTLQRFVIRDFEPLESTSLAAAFSDLRSISGQWEDAEDIWRDAIELRGSNLH